MQFPATTITAILVASATSTSGVPNIIIMQPDDFPVYTGWGAPPNDPFEVNSLATDPPVTLTNIEKLFGEGVKMTQAYIASSACGTSRYATMTGKYPSRSSTGRERAVSDNDAVVKVNIPGSKLLDVPGYGDDCSSDNMAVHLKNYGGYRTGIVGKWHLGDTDASTFDYDILRSDIQGCGFDFAEGLYAENLGNQAIHGGSLDQFSHNQEWVTSEALNFINADYTTDTTEQQKPFMLYFNPTVPHSGHDVFDSMFNYDCKETADFNNNPGTEPLPQYYQDTFGVSTCREYRDNVLLRAGSTDDKDLGAILIDDSVGALLDAIDDNTIFLFQQDHGLKGKNTMFETGNRISQFIRYPGVITASSTFDGLVSNIDIAPTMFDFAGILDSVPYTLDGVSWKDALSDVAMEKQMKEERCLLFEFQKDRAVRCGCYKQMDLDVTVPSCSVSGVSTNGSKTCQYAFDLGYPDIDSTQIFDVCGGSSDVALDWPSENQEQTEVTTTLTSSMLGEALDCFSELTHPTSDGLDSATTCDRFFSNTCSSNSECSDSAVGDFCTTSGGTVTEGRCVECNRNTQCSNGYCRDNRCVDCINGDSSFCPDPSNTCVNFQCTP